MADFAFPRDLRDAQLRLHQERAAYTALCRELPWSVEPAPGWEGDKQLHSDRIGGMPDSPGYSETQKGEEARLRNLLVDLSIVVSTHPYWSDVDQGEVVCERMALKRTPSALSKPLGDGASGRARPGDAASALTTAA
ncbi:hypothetical protein [Streptomyces albipurpureus]|uniref:Transposase n=1 Tax=Streptomyces albipurpureus TaxID=2897419 RepID=A0ABT0UZB8_9ACTN|nr:hypothetical protein [Streptomyces sp. CWNU-1]MCM2393904.1 hypothetical protein [Streptomyces sp. CWNU-1]